MSERSRGAPAVRLGGDGDQTFDVIIDGEPLRACPGETIATVMLTAGRRAVRETVRRREPRGLYCVMGVCWECVVRVDDSRPGSGDRVRACVTLVTPGMRIETGAM